jgi:3-oxoacyl-[acyl-carrier protein] reductase
VAGTDLFGDGLPAARESMLVRQTALGRAGDPADVAELGFYLCSPAGAYVTSQILQINGGSQHGV